MSTVRLPAVAGSFYPAEPAVLRRTVERLLAQAAPAQLQAADDLRALIAPHAGYIYSGPTAGVAYRCLQEHWEQVRRVVVIGPAHRVPVFGMATSSADAFATPLGEMPVDRASRERILELPFVYVSDEAHREEHCLEVQLPFLQVLSSTLMVLPLVVGEARAEQVAELFARLDEADTLILVSSDLSHFYDYVTAGRLDQETATAIRHLHRLEHGQACGRTAINGLLLRSREMGWQAHVLDVCNSGDTAGPRGRVVGYGAFAFTAPNDTRSRSV